MYNINKNRYANKYNPIVKESGEPKFIKKEAFYEQIKQKSAKETLCVGTKNAFNYHGNSHGTLFKDGNSFEIKVNGPTKITLGGCQYSPSGSITASSADGSYTETKEAKTKDCYHNDSNYTNEELKLLT